MLRPSKNHLKQPVRTRKTGRRRGTALALFLVCLIPLIGCVALAVDLGMVTVAQTQLRDAADACALAGGRTLNGDSANNNNYSNVLPNAQKVLSNAKMLQSTLTNSQLSVDIGRYVYNTSAQQFEGQFPGTSGTNWNMCRATITANISSLAFSKLFNFSLSNMQAVATAVHRPRDIAMILDYSGSMRFGSLVGMDQSTTTRVSNNRDTIYPVFGHYSSSSAALQGAIPSAPYDDANITATTSDGRAPIVQDFYTNATGTAAFSAAASSLGTTPGGDNFLTTSKDTTSTYAQTVGQVLNIASPTNSSRDATFETSGYQSYSMNTSFSKYTQGPGYWGKTFFIWPPDPRAANDWRKLYFTYYGTSTAMDDNSKLWDSSGNWKAPSSGFYSINYTAILNFIKNVGPNPFPAKLQSGRILYYDAIPTTIDTSVWPPTDMNQRFWKDYIDYVLGVMQTGTSTYQVICDGSTGQMGYGVDYTWGTVKITANSTLTGSPKPYMHYADNPKRPKMHFWFGPLSMVDFLGNYNLWYTVNPDCSRFCWWPGTCHEAPLYACKLGIQAALNDIKTNHPSDMLSMIMFSTPKTSSTDTSAARFNRVRVPLGQNYTNLTESLWYPPATLGNSTATVRPYDANNLEVPRAMGGTCYSIGLMLAYNQFSGNSGLRTYNTGGVTGDAGGNGRKGAQKIIIFETDGAPNTNASASFNNTGAYQSYYSVRYNSANPGGSEYPTGVTGYSDNASTVTTQIYSLCTQLAAQDSAGGFSTSSKPLLIHCIAFGPGVSTGLPTLRQMQTIGNVDDNMPSYKIIDGNDATIVSNLQIAVEKILQDGVQVSLIQ
ncbi:MAG: Tad domain-containing protein [Planctomycetia bacterium]|nr:Tad domain-containing protein [Planctomycetia bacterium]